MKYLKLAGIILVTILLCGSAFYVWAYFNETSDEIVATTPEVPEPTPQEILPEPEPVPEEKVFVDTTDPNERVPDLVPLPARDLKLAKNDEGDMTLYFSTTYYNQGRGPLELRVEDETTNLREDVERTVAQRIYRVDDSYRDVPVGVFLWHQEHLHYHFDAFVEYDLAPVDANGHEDLEGSRIKSTFCLRDVSKVDLPFADRPEEAGYKICGKYLQGVSVGWGDTYYWDYPAQNLNVSSLPSGTYQFITRVNPSDVLEEINYENNVSVVTFKIDTELGLLEVLSETPSSTPNVEHVHLDDPFGM
jgi:hypothetical protein